MQPLRRLVPFWNWLPAFRAVAESQHLPTASRELNVTAPALSRSAPGSEALPARGSSHQTHGPGRGFPRCRPRWHAARPQGSRRPAGHDAPRITVHPESRIRDAPRNRRPERDPSAASRAASSRRTGPGRGRAASSPAVRVIRCTASARSRRSRSSSTSSWRRRSRVVTRAGLPTFRARSACASRTCISVVKCVRRVTCSPRCPTSSRAGLATGRS